MPLFPNPLSYAEVIEITQGLKTVHFREQLFYSSFEDVHLLTGLWVSCKGASRSFFSPNLQFSKNGRCRPRRPVVGHIPSFWNSRTFQYRPEWYRVFSKNIWFTSFPPKFVYCLRRREDGSKMRVALGLVSRIWVAARKWEDSCFWKAKAVGWLPWNVSAIGLAWKQKRWIVDNFHFILFYFIFTYKWL